MTVLRTSNFPIRRPSRVALLFQRFALASSLAFSWSSFGFVSPEQFEKDTSKAKVLVFLSKDCPCSKSHVKHLNQLNSEHANVAFFGVSTDIWESKTQNQILQYYDKQKFNFPIIKDTQQFLVKKYAALKTPHTVLLLKEKPQNDYHKAYEGGVTDHRIFDKSKHRFLDENLKAYRNGQPMKHRFGKSLGCYIRRI